MSLDAVQQWITDMRDMPQHMDGMMHGFVVSFFLLLVLLPLAIVSIISLSRNTDKKEFRLPAAALLGRSFSPVTPQDPKSASAADTLFILPDISGYTRFLTLNQLGLDHAQSVIFSLLNAILDVGAARLEFSKLEGDAALFIAHPKQLPPTALGEELVRMVQQFDAVKHELVRANLCPCQVCRHIDDLDLKIFVHRGEATRFEFSGGLDVFGANAIVLHRLMKNRVRSRRYIMLTQAASSSAELPIDCESYLTHVHAEHIGGIDATVFELPSPLPVRGLPNPTVRRVRPSTDLWFKLRRNVASILNSVRFLRRVKEET